MTTSTVWRVSSGQDTSGRIQKDSLNNKERKRLQNRIAQRTYRQNQKHRILTLEAAIAQVPETSLTSLPLSATNLPDQASESTRTNSSSSIEDSFLWPVNPAGAWNDTSPVSVSTTDWSRTPLHIAVFNGNESMTRLLLEQGADATRKDGDGNTPLHIAAETGAEGLIHLLLKKPANLNTTDLQGRTALFSAVQSKNEVAVKLLLEASIDVNMQDVMGHTALHLAVECGSETLTLLLLAYGANING